LKVGINGWVQPIENAHHHKGGKHYFNILTAINIYARVVMALLKHDKGGIKRGNNRIKMFQMQS